MIPQGTYGYGKRGCAQRGWTYVGEVRAGGANAQLEKVAGDLPGERTLVIDGDVSNKNVMHYFRIAYVLNDIRQELN